jgi:hypothetical protein
LESIEDVTAASYQCYPSPNLFIKRIFNRIALSRHSFTSDCVTVYKRETLLKNKIFMSRNNIIIAALAGAAAAALIANYLGTEKGKEFLDTASSTLKDLTGKATEYAKNSLGNLKAQKDEAQVS